MIDNQVARPIREYKIKFVCSVCDGRKYVPMHPEDTDDDREIPCPSCEDGYKYEVIRK